MPIVLHAAVVDTLTKYEDLFQMMILSDQAATSNGLRKVSTQKLLQFRFFVPPQAEMEELRRLTEMAMHYVDLVASKVTLSREVR